jgi:sec-independent protein translocase protein TatA
MLAFNLGTQEIVILLLIGVLLFGRRLPEVGRYLGKGLVEFKKGFKGLEDDVMHDTASHTTSAPSPNAIEPPRPPQRVGVTAPKFQDAPANTNIAGQPQPPQESARQWD